MTRTSTFMLQARDSRNALVTVEGFSDGMVMARMRFGRDVVELPAELVRQLRTELESQALDRVAAYARERAEDMLDMRDQSSRPDSRMSFEDSARVYREMAAKALAEKES